MGAYHKLGTQRRRVGGETSDDCAIAPRGQAAERRVSTTKPEQGRCGRSHRGLEPACDPPLPQMPVFPRSRLRPLMSCCLATPSRQRALQLGLCTGGHFMETPLQPLCEFLLPPGYAPARLRLSVTHQLLTGLPLPLIPFLFGFNEPNPLVSPWRQGGGYCERVVVWGKSRKLSLGPGMRGSHALTLCIRILFNSHNSPMWWGEPHPRVQIWMLAQRASESAQVTVCPGMEPGRGPPPEITPEPFGQSIES